MSVLGADADVGVNYRVYTPPTPAAGSTLEIVVPGGYLWQPLSLRFVFTCSAAAATRQVEVYFGDGSVNYALVSAHERQTANQGAAYSFLRGLGAFAGTIAQARIMVPLPDLVLPAGHEILIDVPGIQVGDTISSPRLFVREYTYGGPRAGVEHTLIDPAAAIAALSG